VVRLVTPVVRLVTPVAVAGPLDWTSAGWWGPSPRLTFRSLDLVDVFGLLLLLILVVCPQDVWSKSYRNPAWLSDFVCMLHIIYISCIVTILLNIHNLNYYYTIYTSKLLLYFTIYTSITYNVHHLTI